MTTARFEFVEALLPAFAAFMERYDDRTVGLRRDIERGAAVAEVLLNLPDFIFRGEAVHLNVQNFKTSRDYRESFWRREFAYEVMCDFANASKHKTSTRTGRLIDSIDDVQEAYALCIYRDCHGDYFRTRKVISITTRDGQSHDLRRLLVRAVKLWATELEILGLTPAISPTIFSYSEFVQRDDDEVKRPLEVVCRKGEQMTLKSLVLEFDRNLGELRPASPGRFSSRKLKLDFNVVASPFDA